VAETAERPIPALDEAQREVVEAPVSARLVVTAGPGTGKTFTLLRRTEWLIDEGGVDQADLLVLSFSRAAVETVAERSGAETDLGRLPVRTIDSMAGRLLLEADIDTEGKSFDQRIGAARAALERESDLLPPGRFRHVLVDEAQDVVSVRAAFVRRLLEHICRDATSGFTIFGDSAQAIYDFQMQGSRKKEVRLLELVGNDPLSCVRTELRTNYRMRDGRLTDFAKGMGVDLRDPSASDGLKHVQSGKNHVRYCLGWDRPEDAAPEIRASYEGPSRSKVAVLTRSNVEALTLGVKLIEQGLDVRVQHRAVDRGAAPWLASLFGSVPVLAARVPDSPRVDDRQWMSPPDDLLRVLRHSGVARDREVDLDRLAAILRSGGYPEEMVARREAPVTVSTIHRAKGLEFDVVYVVDSDRKTDVADAIEEARILYVAATRARDELYSGAAVEWDGPVSGFDENRAKVCSWKKRNRPRYLEIKVSDFDPDWVPAEIEEFPRLQQLIQGDIEPGEPMELRLAPGSTEDERLYDLVHLGRDEVTVVGRTTSDFGAMLKAQLLGRAPPTITGLVAEIPDTVSMGAAAAERVGLAEHGLHLRARAFGLGRFGWEFDD
jgi:DNA helicase II / ATP-dependent DNA helicase PcrA